MGDAKQTLKEYVQKLKTERDELRLKLKLSNMEFRDHWDNAARQVGADYQRPGAEDAGFNP